MLLIYAGYRQYLFITYNCHYRDHYLKVPKRKNNFPCLVKEDFIRNGATILNHKAFCRSVGLSADQVKFIQVQSDFPIEHRPIIPLNVAYLNYNNFHSPEVQASIARAVDNIMS